MAAEIKEVEAFHLMFTYGTLKSGQTNHHILTNTENGRATLLGPAKTLKKWPLVLVSAYEIPCLLPLEDVGHEVSGELYLIDDRMLSVLDSLETHPDVYVRVQEDVVSLPQQANSSALDAEAKFPSENSPSTNTAEPRKAWIYFLRKIEREHLSMPFVPSYAQRPDIVYPAFKGDKEESLRFLDNAFEHVTVNDD